MTAAESLPAFLAGLVFFLLGLDGVKSSLKALASRAMRRRLQNATASPVRAALLGVGIGAVGQSTSAICFILGGFVSARLLTLPRAIIVVAWSHPGIAVLPFVAAVNLNVATLWIIGLAGLGLRQRRFTKASAALGTLLGIGFLLYGLFQLKGVAGPIQSAPWFASVSVVLNTSLLVGFLIGIALRVLIQSSSGIAVILITLCAKGLLEPSHALMVIHGTGVGIGVSMLVLGHGLRDDARRLALWQAASNVCAGLLMGLWMLIASTGAVPSIVDLLNTFEMRTETDLAVGFLVQMSLVPLLAMAFAPWTPQVLARLVPDVAEEQLAKPMFISDSTASAPELAADLAQREQLRILRAAPGLLDRARIDTAASSGVNAATLRTSLDGLHREIAEFLGDSAEHAKDHDTNALILAAIGREQLIAELIDALDALARETATLANGSPARALCGRMVESTDAMLHTLADALESGDEMDREILNAMTSDRSEQMEAIRSSAAAASLGAARDQATLLYVTSLFERLHYIARRVV
jgi:phosphate:Na+ symporter